MADKRAMIRLRVEDWDRVNACAEKEKVPFAEALHRIIERGARVDSQSAAPSTPERPAERLGDATATEVPAPKAPKVDSQKRTDLAALKRDPEDEAARERALNPLAKSKATGHPFDAPKGLTVFADRERDYGAADFGMPTEAVPAGSAPAVAPPPGGWDAWTQPRAPISPLPPSDAPRPPVDPRTLAESKPGALPDSLEAMIAKAAPTDPMAVIAPEARAAVARLDLDAIRHVEVDDEGEIEVAPEFTVPPPARKGDPEATGDAHGFDWPRR